MATSLGKSRGTVGGFSLIELLVTVSIISLLMGVLLPSLSKARRGGKSVVCRSNLRQLVLANGFYAEDYGTYSPGAADFLSNLHRWHGARERVSEAFDPAGGPLTDYLGPTRAVRRCPAFPVEQLSATDLGFERGNGGYGYNNRYLGVQLSEVSPGRLAVADDRVGALPDWVKRPAETIMFTDCAFAANGLIEYAFAEPRFHLAYGEYRAVPSIHFRHLGLANVGWCDGHVDGRRMTYTRASDLYPTRPEQFDIGWFGAADDNRLFDLR